MSVIINGSSGITTNAGGLVNPSTNIEGINYACRAWVNFDGTTSPPTIRGSGNVTSVTRAATGDYTITFTNAMPDANYAITGTSAVSATGAVARIVSPVPADIATGSLRIRTSNDTGVFENGSVISIAIFR